MKMGPIGCTETSLRNDHYLLQNNPEGRISHLLRCGVMKSRKGVKLDWFSLTIFRGFLTLFCQFPLTVNS